MRNSLQALSYFADQLAKNKAFLESVDYAVELCNNKIYSGGKILICGNGGSHADALHFAEEFTCKFSKDRRPLPCIALGSNGPHITATGNDYGFKYIFSREIYAFSSDSALIVLSTSGHSENIIEALKTAYSLGIPSIALVGNDPSEVADYASIVIQVPHYKTAMIQEIHMHILHYIVSQFESWAN